MPLARLCPPRPRRARSELLAPDSYLTDGHRLFRVVSRFAADTARAFASLEDRLTLEVQAPAPGELDAMRLRPLYTPARR